MSQSDEIVAAFDALKKAGRLKDVMTGEYRCRRGCLLGAAFQIPAGLMLYVPAYRLSRSRNAQTSHEGARRKNTIDGDRLWRARGFNLTALQEWDGYAAVDLQCDHVSQSVVRPEALIQELGQPSSPTRVLFPRDE